MGERFVRALAEKNAGELKALLRADVDFRAMTPGRFWEPSGVEAIVDETLLGKWFEPEDEITEIIELETGHVGPRDRVRYRFRVVSPDGDHVVEQQAYFDTDGQEISWLRIMCSGYLPDT